METIEDIVADIRAQNQGLPEDGYALSPYVHDLLNLADRIEQAVTNCNGFKMCEALKEIWGIIKVFNRGLVSTQKTTDTIEEIIKQVLSTPPRNCDLYKSESEAYQAYLTKMKNATKKTYVYFEPWLFAEVKRRIV